MWTALVPAAVHDCRDIGFRVLEVKLRIEEMLGVSVVMATFNGSRFLRMQLTSLAIQKKQPTELIICDDCSSDDTIRIAMEFANVSPFPVRIHINEKRKGYRRNFMDAATLCSSELIAFCDQDDIWHEDKLLCITRVFADDDDILLACHNARVIELNGAIGRRILPDEWWPLVNHPLSLGPFDYTLGFTQVFRRRLLMFSHLNADSTDQNFPDQTLAHDQWFFFLASVLGKIAYVDQDLVDYRQHDKNVFGLPVERSMIKRSMIETIDLRLQQRGDHFERYSLVSRNRVLILTTIGGDKQYTSCISGKAIKGAVQYQKLSNWFETRAQIYQRQWFYDRFLSWISMVRSGGYMNTCWAFPKRSAVRDIVLGVLLGPKLDWLAVLVKELADKKKAQSAPLDVGCK
jgi:glycosyltransferase involved in cell wall biosynthesis